MTIENKFNLVDEPWVPVVGRGLVSLATIFSDNSLPALGGNPVQKIALFKLLLAIVQTAYTPMDEDDWEELGIQEISKKSLDYLRKNQDLFWLYGEKPFLQMPIINKLITSRKNDELKSAKKASAKAKAQDNAMPKYIGSAEIPDLPSENNTMLTQNQGIIALSDAEKAVFILTLMNFALAGKHTEKDLPPLSVGYVGKSISAKAGPSLGMPYGYLHSFLIGDTILDSLRINILTHEQIGGYRLWSNKLGKAPWETMPKGEDCATAQNLKNSYMGCLVALCRFVFLRDDGIYYMEGIQYPNHKAGWKEPSIAIKETESTPKILWVNPEKRPWRELTALFSFIDNQNIKGYDCQQIRWTLERAKGLNHFSVWSGGLKVRYSAGGQSVKQDDDYVESEIQIDSAVDDNINIKDIWFQKLKQEVTGLELLSKITWSSTNFYYKSRESDGKEQASQAANIFWQLCERKFRELINACNEDSDENLKKLRIVFSKFVDKAYNTYCPKETARQLDAWAKNRPNFSKYLR